MKRLITLFVTLILVLSCTEKKSELANIESCIDYINQYNLNKARDCQFHIDSKTRALINSEYQYLKTGTLKGSIFSNHSLESSKTNYKTICLFDNYEGDYLKRVSNKFNDVAYQNYLKSLNLAKANSDNFFVCESLIRILYCLQSNHSKELLSSYQQYSKELLKNAENDTHKFWAHYYYLSFRLINKLEYKQPSYITSESFDSLFSFTNNNDHLKGKVFHLKGLFHSYNDTGSAIKAYKEATGFYLKNNDFYAQISANRVKLNLAVNEFKNGNIDYSISQLHNITKNRFFHKDLIFKIYTYRWLIETYEKGNKSKDSLIKFYSVSKRLEKELNNFEIATSIDRENTKYKLTTLERIVKNLQHYKWFYISGLIITFILALYSFIRWQKSDRIKAKTLKDKIKIEEEKQVLEQEHQETLSEVKKIKQLVTKEHIVLKNKSKVYLSELIYLKSDDHYLQLYTLNKKEFVRGKISEIIEQLPPNFVQTHRSYIVNRNFIQSISGNSIFLKDKTEIPISRKYKSLLNDN